MSRTYERLSPAASPVIRELHAAWAEKGWSVETLLERSKLRCDRTSMGRKIRGIQGVTVDEIQSIARALGLRLVLQRRDARAA